MENLVQEEQTLTGIISKGSDYVHQNLFYFNKNLKEEYQDEK